MAQDLLLRERVGDLLAGSAHARTAEPSDLMCKAASIAYRSTLPRTSCAGAIPIDLRLDLGVIERVVLCGLEMDLREDAAPVAVGHRTRAATK